MGKRGKLRVRVLVELVPDLEELWPSAQVPKVKPHIHFGEIVVHSLHAIVRANRRDILRVKMSDKNNNDQEKSSGHGTTHTEAHKT